MLRFLWRHAIATLIIIAVAGWALFYVPGTPSYAVFQLKRAIDARSGDAAADYVDFPSVVRNAGYEMVQQNAAKNGDGIFASLFGKGAVDLLTQPTAAVVKTWAVRQVDDGAKDVQMPAGVVAGAILFIHRSGDTAWTNFRDNKGREWKIRMALENGRWQIVEVKDIQQLIARIEHEQEKRLNSPGMLPGAPPAPGAPSGGPPAPPSSGPGSSY